MKKISLIRKFAERINLSASGLAPGTEIKSKRSQKSATTFEEITYDKEKVETNPLGGYMSLAKPKDNQISWLRISGMDNHQQIHQYLSDFGAHPLVIEDIFNVMHRPKVEDFDHYVFMTLKYPKISADSEKIELEQVSLLHDENRVISISEDDIPSLSIISDRIANPESRFRRMKADYLFYSLVDLVVDLYKPALETLYEIQLELEETMMEKNDPAQLAHLQKIRKVLILFRQNLLPLKEAVMQVIREKPRLLDQNQIKYFRDVLDHIQLALDQINSNTEQNSNLTDTFLGLQSFRMNEVMKTLTIIATIFIPLTFIAGIYGMNFDHMPELHYKFGYPIIWGVMLLTVIGLMIFFRRKKWL